MPWAPYTSKFTFAFGDRTAYLAQHSSKTVVSAMQRIAWRSVGWIIRRVVARHRDESSVGLDELRTIGVDEHSYMRKHKYVTVVVDHDKQRVVWASEGKSAASLTRFFEDLGPDHCSQIEAVTIDMSEAYIKAVTSATPAAQLIFDRFHDQRLAYQALDETRRDEVRKATGKDEKKALKGVRWSL